MPDARLVIDDVEYFGWQEVEVVRSIDTLAGRLKLRLTSIDPLPVPRGKRCEMYLSGNLILTGYIYNVNVDTNGTKHSLSVVARDLTGDLVDADALVDSQEVSGLTLREIIEIIIKPFGITATFEIDPPEKFKKFSFQQESAFEAIERACRLRGVFPSSDEAGNLVIREYGATRAGTGLEMGQNVLTAGAGYDDTDRFSEYHVHGQQPGTGGVEAEEAAGPNGKATDAGMTRYRPKLIIAEGAVDSGLAQQRAEWEATVRAAKAVTVEVTVADWVQEDGTLWRENQIARTILPQHGIDGDMLIREVSYTTNENEGTHTTLALVRPDAYTKQPDLEAEEAGLEDDGGESE